MVSSNMLMWSNNDNDNVLLTKYIEAIIVNNVSTIKKIWSCVCCVARSIINLGTKLIIDVIIPFLECDDANVDENVITHSLIAEIIKAD